MALTLQVTSYKNRAPSNELSVTVTETGCTIGRASNNDLVLPDVERIISHRHAIIEFENGVYYLLDNSTNGSFINHAPDAIGQGNRVLLHDGDILSLGGYDCAISIGTKENKASSPLLDDSANWQPPLHSEVHEDKPSIDKIFNQQPETPAPAAPLPGSGPDASIGQDFFKPPDPILEDWDELTGLNKAKEAKPTPIIPEEIYQPEAAAPEPVIKAKPEIQPEVKPALKTSKHSENLTNLDRKAVDAFLAGAGINNTELEDESIISFMNTSGQILREITKGFRQVMDSRTSLKGEFRLGMTTIQPSENNPLKFSIDADDALNKLLFPPPKGYMPPLVAIQDATDDLQAHQMAFLAGLRAALHSLVSLFDPMMLEKDLQDVSAVDNLLPSIKKAKYWEAFKEQYKQTAADAENDFLHFLGNEFATAYEKQINILKSNRHKN